MNSLNEIAQELVATGGELTDVKPLDGNAPIFGRLIESGPSTEESASDFGFVFESVFEGYLLHTGRPRLMLPGESQLKLVAGDFLYSLGLQRLAQLGDLEAVELLAGLITDASCLHIAKGTAEQKGALWVATVVATAFRPEAEHRKWPFTAAAAGSESAAKELIDKSRAGSDIDGQEGLFQRTFDEIYASLAR